MSCELVKHAEHRDIGLAGTRRRTEQQVVSAVQGGLQCRSVLLDMERARMELEDLRSQNNALEMALGGSPAKKARV